MLKTLHDQEDSSLPVEQSETEDSHSLAPHGAYPGGSLLS